MTVVSQLTPEDAKLLRAAARRIRAHAKDMRINHTYGPRGHRDWSPEFPEVQAEYHEWLGDARELERLARSAR